MSDDPLPPLPLIETGRYRHHKGGEYDAVGVLRHSETLEPMVLYRSLADASRLWVRPYAMFVEGVETPGGRQPRFARLADVPGAEGPVQRQLEAYNARDLDRFLAEYRDDIVAFRPPAAAPSLDGKAAFAAFYRDERFNRPGLHAELVGRQVLGATVVDHERISGVREQPFEVAVVYRVVDGLIASTWSFPAE